MIHEKAQVKTYKRSKTKKEYYQINLSNKTQLKNENVTIIKNADFEKLCEDHKKVKSLNSENNILSLKIQTLQKQNDTLQKKIDDNNADDDELKQLRKTNQNLNNEIQELYKKQNTYKNLIIKLELGFDIYQNRNLLSRIRNTIPENIKQLKEQVYLLASSEKEQ